jgi:L-aminopeptidase/D-esterase-like protein
MRPILATLLLLATLAQAQTKPRARDLGVPFDGAPGALNAITDIAGVEVGHTTIISGEGKLKVGSGPVRTGVTAVFPRGKESLDGVFAGWFSLNGNGEMTGTTWLEESGYLAGPVMITNTHSVGVVHDAVIEWYVRRSKRQDPELWSLPVVTETWDGWLNDTNGFHVKPQHVFQAMDSAHSGPVTEGSVGGGTGMICNQFKGGIGTSSRVVQVEGKSYTVGVLVQCNFGRRAQLMIAGVPVGKEIPDDRAYENAPTEQGSIIIVVATDAPLLPHQLKRLTRRAGMGLARTGSYAGNGSGDIFIAFSTAHAVPYSAKGVQKAEFLGNESMDPLFIATIQATEESIVNAMVAADTMIGVNGRRAPGLPHDRLREVLKKYNRLNPSPTAKR